MFKNVLVGVDGRAGGRDAIALACKLTNPDGKLTLAHVHSGDLRPSHVIAPWSAHAATVLSSAWCSAAPRKLRLSTRAELVGYALERGLVSPGGGGGGGGGERSA